MENHNIKAYPFNFSSRFSSFLTYSCNSYIIASSVDSNFWRSIFDVKYPSLVSKRSGDEEPTSSRSEDDEDDEGKLTKLRMPAIGEGSLKK